ncbi:MAG TPA: glycosyltransferase [Candidatus Norongarragalinales archaeon]|jgi:1,2-diacylglycerol 3-alpha-glucosyltransferase|nr:glycosyltransferase [Candidatus Norongarragalinales archaeon]
MKRLRIGFFTDTWLPNVDGVVFSLLNYRRELEKGGHKVFIYTAGDAKTKGAEKNPSVHYYKGIKFPLYKQYQLALKPFKAARQARTDGIDIVHCHGIAGMGIAALQTGRSLHLPKIATFHTMIPIAAEKLLPGPQRFKNFAGKIAWRAIVPFYKKFDIVTTPGASVAKLLKKNGLRHVEVVPNGIDTKHFSPATFTQQQADELKKKIGVGDDEPLIACVGRLSKEKNVDVVLKAARILKHQGLRFKLLIGGDGPTRSSLERQAKRLGLLDVTRFAGFIPNQQLPLYYKASDLYVTASTFETQSLSLMEAMACGKICIGANALAIPDAITEGKNGFLFEPGNATQCAQKIMRALALPQQQKEKFMTSARNATEKYSIEASTRKLESVYKAALRTRG